MSVFTHGVNSKDKPQMIDHNKVFTVALANKTLRHSAGAVADRQFIPLDIGFADVPGFHREA